jgi:hypothetical protein
MLGSNGSAGYGLACGFKCEVVGSHGMAIGLAAKANYGQVALCRANDPNKQYINASNKLVTPLFLVGNGEADGSGATKRSNAFVVLDDGTGYLGDKKVLVDGDLPEIITKDDIDQSLQDFKANLLADGLESRSLTLVDEKQNKITLSPEKLAKLLKLIDSVEISE